MLYPSSRDVDAISTSASHLPRQLCPRSFFLPRTPNHWVPLGWGSDVLRLQSQFGFRLKEGRKEGRKQGRDAGRKEEDNDSDTLPKQGRQSSNGGNKMYLNALKIKSNTSTKPIKTSISTKTWILFFYLFVANLVYWVGSVIILRYRSQLQFCDFDNLLIFYFFRRKCVLNIGVWMRNGSVWNIIGTYRCIRLCDGGIWIHTDVYGWCDCPP